VFSISIFVASHPFFTVARTLELWLLPHGNDASRHDNEDNGLDGWRNIAFTLKIPEKGEQKAQSCANA